MSSLAPIPLCHGCPKGTDLQDVLLKKDELLLEVHTSSDFPSITECHAHHWIEDLPDWFGTVAPFSDIVRAFPDIVLDRFADKDKARLIYFGIRGTPPVELISSYNMNHFKKQIQSARSKSERMAILQLQQQQKIHVETVEALTKAQETNRKLKRKLLNAEIQASKLKKDLSEQKAKKNDLIQGLKSIVSSHIGY